MLDALVRSALVVVALVLAQKVGKMLVVDEQHVVEQLAACATDETSARELPSPARSP